MHSEERNGAILLVSAAEKLNESLLKLLSREHWGPVTLKTEAHQARELLKARHFEYVLVCASDPGEPAALLARDTVQHTGAGVLVLTPAQSYEALSAVLAPLGVLVLARPLSSQLLLQAMLLLQGTRSRLKGMEKRAASLEEKVEEMRIVNCAKYLLIEQLQMTEAQAHHYIEKRAMDRCVTKRVVAESILSTYK